VRKYPADACGTRRRAGRDPGLAEQAAERTVRAHAVHTARRAEHERSALNGYGDAPLDPAAAAHAIAANLPPDAVVVEEAITSGVQLRRFLRLDRPRSLVHTVGGGLGSGIGMAVGTRLGDPSRPCSPCSGTAAPSSACKACGAPRATGCP